MTALDRTQQLKALPDDQLKAEAKRLYEVIYVRSSGAVADVKEFDTIRDELLSRGLKIRSINTIYFCNTC